MAGVVGSQGLFPEAGGRADEIAYYCVLWGRGKRRLCVGGNEYGIAMLASLVMDIEGRIVM